LRVLGSAAQRAICTGNGRGPSCKKGHARVRACVHARPHLPARSFRRSPSFPGSALPLSSLSPSLPLSLHSLSPLSLSPLRPSLSLLALLFSPPSLFRVSLHPCAAGLPRTSQSDAYHCAVHRPLCQRHALQLRRRCAVNLRLIHRRQLVPPRAALVRGADDLLRTSARAGAQDAARL
jgi:hypothetical protein